MTTSEKKQEIIEAIIAEFNITEEAAITIVEFSKAVLEQLQAVRELKE